MTAKLTKNILKLFYNYSSASFSLPPSLHPRMSVSDNNLNNSLVAGLLYIKLVQNLRRYIIRRSKYPDISKVFRNFEHFSNSRKLFNYCFLVERYISEILL